MFQTQEMQKIFSGATDVEVKQYFSELTVSTDLPPPRTILGKGDIYICC